MALAPAAWSAEIAFAASAIEKSLARDVFSEQGKHVLSGRIGTCNYAYLEWPKVKLSGGRLAIQVHFSGRASFEVLGNCVGAGEAFYLTATGRPILRGATLSIDDIRVDSEKREYVGILTALIGQQLPNALKVDLKEELSKLLRSGDTPYALTLPKLEVQGVTAEDGVLRIRFDFTIEAR